MPFINIQNHEIKLAFNSAGLVPEVIGDRRRAFSGKPVSTRRSIKKTWECKTIPMIHEDALFLIALLNGEGHTWKWNDATNWSYSSKGLGLAVSTGVSRNASGSKFGSASITITTGNFAQYNVGYNFEWTAMVWKGDDATWTGETHYIVNSSGEKWVDGVRNDAAGTPFITMSSGNFQLHNTASVGYYDDLILIPADITPSFAEDYGVMSSSFGPLPRIRVNGDMIQGTYQVEGFDVTSKYIQAVESGTWQELVETSFSMRQEIRTS